MILAGYGRVSTAREAQLESLENQIAFFSQYAQAHGHQLYRVYADEGISGKQMKNRGEFQRMLADARQHRFDMVVVKDISRFARNTVDLLTATRELRACGIEVQFLSNNQTILGNSEFVLTVFGALAQEESASLSQRVKFGKKLNAQKGRVPNRVYGYRRLDTFHLEIVEEEAAVVRRAFRLYVEQGLGTRRICAELNNGGLRTREGALWRPTTLRRMLQNPLYCGVLETHKYDTVDFISGKKRLLEQEERFRLERPELAVVSRELWERAQAIFRERRGTSAAESADGESGRRERYSAAHRFSTLLRCAECGYSFSRRHWSSKKSGVVHYWVCSGRNSFGSEFCRNGTSLSERDFTEALGRYLRGRIADRAAFARRVEKTAARRLEEGTGTTAEEVEKKLSALARREVRLKELYAADLLSMDELRRSLEALQENRRELQARKFPAGAEVCFDWDRFTSLSEWTNADLRRLVDEVRVEASGGVEVRLKDLAGTRP